MPPPLWPHQSRAIDEIVAHVNRGVRRILLTSPTGGGKSRIMWELIAKLLAEREWKSVVYTNRRLLVDQLVKVLTAAGVEVGVRAAGRHPRPDIPVQVSSIQTEESRVYKRKGHLKWELHQAQFVVIDECHLNSGKKEASVAAKVKRDHFAAGAVILEVTATPLDLDGTAEVVVVAGTNSELRATRPPALVLARHYAPDEPDLRYIGLTEVTKTNDLSEPQTKKLMGQVDKDGKANIKLQRLFGRVLDWFDVLNPERKPTILFAPGVAESRWFAQEFTAWGISAAHIDGDDIWTVGSGDLEATSTTRNELLEMSRDGTLTVLCNRFVLREGVDCPWLGHGIFATAFGSLQSYLQSGGRLLRAFPGLDHVTIQDHGGNWWRHGSLNADRHWPLGCSSRVASGQREDGLRDKKVKEPMRCPQCACIMVSLRCVCGFVLDPRAKTRPVVQENGSLLMMEGDIFRERVEQMRPDTQQLWDKCFWRARNGGMTFRGAVGLFFQENGYWPPRTLANMPAHHDDQWLKVGDVNRDDLIAKEPTLYGDD